MKKNNNNKILGSAIRHQRKQLGLTQKQLAEFAGCGEAFLHLLEHGKPSVRMDKLMSVLKILGLQLKLVQGKEPISVDERLL